VGEPLEVHTGVAGGARSAGVSEGARVAGHSSEVARHAKPSARRDSTPSPEPAHPAVVALLNGSSVVAWDVDRNGNRRITVAQVSSDASRPRLATVPGTEGASYPQLAALPDGSVALAWTQLVGDRTRLGLARIAPRR
jgi:hypothetical protein